MIVACDAGRLRPDGVLAFALAGLAARGHVVRTPRRAPAGSPLAAVSECVRLPFEAHVVVGEGAAAHAGWLAARVRARALVLALEPGSGPMLSGLDRWVWELLAAFGLVHERDVAACVAQLPEHEHARVGLWPDQAPHGDAVTSALTTTLERACERALARRNAGPGRPGVLLDRDGTLIVERHHLADPAGVELLPGVAAALRAVRAAGFPLAVISNQAGVGRGLYPESAAWATMARLRQLLRAEGVELDAVRFCPHAPEAGCDCRKPGTRLLHEVADDLRLSLLASVMVGDKWIDVQAAQAARAEGVLVRTGHGAEEERQPPEGGPVRARIADDLAAALQPWLAQLH